MKFFLTICLLLSPLVGFSQGVKLGSIPVTNNTQSTVETNYLLLVSVGVGTNAPSRLLRAISLGTNFQMVGGTISGYVTNNATNLGGVFSGSTVDISMLTNVSFGGTNTATGTDSTLRGWNLFSASNFVFGTVGVGGWMAWTNGQLTYYSNSTPVLEIRSNWISIVDAGYFLMIAGSDFRTNTKLGNPIIQSGQNLRSGVVIQKTNTARQGFIRGSVDNASLIMNDNVGQRAFNVTSNGSFLSWGVGAFTNGLLFPPIATPAHTNFGSPVSLSTSTMLTNVAFLWGSNTGSGLPVVYASYFDASSNLQSKVAFSFP